ncbi:glutaredoxin 2 [Oceanimonas doudoroffii]|uniref:Glutaredoxin, GrxB family n=1 Tax=Oceanimonas doudoroffii TaxID=84158 RepID=A0A233RHN5_9GAMM|nr:glutaredoxin 2 [Oceanimonas doudoroffii]OXY82901.1 glutaredoxin, GrxB family [Oceanimonas doudoroffii]
MKLYLFDHCPFCVKAMMAAGYAGLKVEYVYLDNHDVAARERMVGYNAVPILEKDDGSFMAESADIVELLMDNSSKTLAPSAFDERISQWQERYQQTLWNLIFPRDVRLPLPEFAKPEAIEYFTRNKTAMLGHSFEQALLETPAHLADMRAALARLDWLLPPSERADKRLGWDDIHFFPTLRNLTMVSGLEFGTRLNAYLDEVSQLTGVALYRDMAC